MKSLFLAIFSIGALLAAGNNVKLTKVQHEAEAARHSTQAAGHAAKAKKYEANAERLSKQGSNAMQHKWPGLARGPENLQRERALEARRAEAESMEKVAFHREMANKSVDAEP